MKKVHYSSFLVALSSLKTYTVEYQYNEILRTPEINLL